MFTYKRWIVGLVILVVGCCAALPFPRRAMDGSTSTQDLTLPTTADANSQLQLMLATSASTPTNSGAQGLHDQHRIKPLRLSSPRSITGRPKPAAQLPSIEESYPTGIPAIQPPADQFRAPQEETPLDQQARRNRYHQIQDGDTLKELATRYLGDAGQAAAIYNANRSILASPELLPLGRWLRIPAGL